jgi:hypothetical protein
MHHDRVVAFYAAALADPTDASVAADRISEAISSDEPRFRHRVGADADLLLDRRAELSDEDFIALSALATPAYLAAFRDTFGMDITP